MGSGLLIGGLSLAVTVGRTFNVEWNWTLFLNEFNLTEVQTEYTMNVIGWIFAIKLC